MSLPLKYVTVPAKLLDAISKYSIAQQMVPLGDGLMDDKYSLLKCFFDETDISVFQIEKLGMTFPHSFANDIFSEHLAVNSLSWNILFLNSWSAKLQNFFFCP